MILLQLLLVLLLLLRGVLYFHVQTVGCHEMKVNEIEVVRERMREMLDEQK